MFLDKVSYHQTDIVPHFDPLADHIAEVEVVDYLPASAEAQIKVAGERFWVLLTALQSASRPLSRLGLAKAVTRGHSLQKIAAQIHRSLGEVADELYQNPVIEEQEFWSDLISRSLRAVYTVWGVDENENTWSGSGFLLDETGYLFTCAHVAQPPEFLNSIITLTAKNPLHGGRLRLLERNADLDVAVLEFEQGADESYYGLGFGDSNVVPGASIVALGSPEGIEQVATIGTGATDERENLHVPALFIDLTILPGSSGGPVLDASGLVIGIARGSVGEDGGAGLNYVVPVNPIREWVGKVF